MKDYKLKLRGIHASATLLDCVPFNLFRNGSKRKFTTVANSKKKPWPPKIRYKQSSCICEMQGSHGPQGSPGWRHIPCIMSHIVAATFLVGSAMAVSPSSASLGRFSIQFPASERSLEASKYTPVLRMRGGAKKKKAMVFLPSSARCLFAALRNCLLRVFPEPVHSANLFHLVHMRGEPERQIFGYD